MSFEVTDVDDGWRPVEDPAAPKDGHCWLADKEKRMAWESYQGVGFQPMSDVEPAYWRLGQQK